MVVRRSVNVSVSQATHRFLAQPHLRDSTRAVYRQTLDRLVVRFSPDTPVRMVCSQHLRSFLRREWGGRSPATFNRHASVVTSFCEFCAQRGWVDPQGWGVPRRLAPVSARRLPGCAEVEPLWRRRDVLLRDRTLWRLVYETLEPVVDLLSLGVGDVQCVPRLALAVPWDDDRMMTVSSALADDLRSLVSGRVEGPIFVGVGGRSLSYRRAAELLKANTGFTFSQLRDAGALQAASGSLSTSASRAALKGALRRYADPS